MFKKVAPLAVIIIFFVTVVVMGFSQSGRLSALNQFNVKKNTEMLLRTNKCTGCYLAYAKLSGMDLSYANLANANLVGATFIKSTLLGANLGGAKIAGANFTGAQWVDGAICQQGSIGRCIRFNSQ